mgnify:CR=1 FL=1
MMGPRNYTRTRAASIPHAEYEIIWALLLTEEFALDELIDDMAPDKVSEKRLKQAQRRTHRLPEDHLDYTPKEN